MARTRSARMRLQQFALSAPSYLRLRDKLLRHL